MGNSDWPDVPQAREEGIRDEGGAMGLESVSSAGTEEAKGKPQGGGWYIKAQGKKADVVRGRQTLPPRTLSQLGPGSVWAKKKKQAEGKVLTPGGRGKRIGGSLAKLSLPGRERRRIKVVVVTNWTSMGERKKTRGERGRQKNTLLRGEGPSG